MHGTQPIEVRLEAIHSLGGIASGAAADALARAANNADLEPRLRVFARRELVRVRG